MVAFKFMVAALLSALVATAMPVPNADSGPVARDSSGDLTGRAPNIDTGGSWEGGKSSEDEYEW
jgi:hypothetical protein